MAIRSLIRITPAIVYARILNPETVPYDPDKDLEPLGLHLFFAHAIAVQASAPWKTFGELLDYAKKNPDKLRVSTTWYRIHLPLQFRDHPILDRHPIQSCSFQRRRICDHCPIRGTCGDDFRCDQ